MAKVPAPWALTPNVSISFWCPGKLQLGREIWAPRGLRSRVKALHAYLNPWSRPSWQVVGQSRHLGTWPPDWWDRLTLFIVVREDAWCPVTPSASSAPSSPQRPNCSSYQDSPGSVTGPQTNGVTASEGEGPCPLPCHLSQRPLKSR